MAGAGEKDEVRRAVLAAVREHLAISAPFDAIQEEHGAGHASGPNVAAAPAPLEVNGSLVERFREALEAVAGHCAVVRDEEEAAEVLRQVVRDTGARRVAVSDSALALAVAERARGDAELLSDAGSVELFDCDVGVTGAQWAIAETGTLVLESDEERHRLASLVPPVHVAVLRSGRIRQTLGEVLGALNEKGRDGLSRAVTFITGPSRTSDIELTLAIGVHGPGELFVIIIERQ